jgi:hypothetical protein
MHARPKRPHINMGYRIPYLYLVACKAYSISHLSTSSSILRLHVLGLSLSS